jgi:hypothetical protein
MKIYPIETGNFKLDGGAMFGVVPKSLWQRTNPTDEKNMIDILKGDTDRTFGNTGNKLSIRDLEIENINLNRTINKDLRNIYLLITDIYRHVDKKRIDKKIYFTTKQFEEKVQLLKNEFKKNNIEIFKD